MIEEIKEAISKSIAVKATILENKEILSAIESAARLVTEALRADNKVLFCGNGGSAADAQHLAAELSGRFYADRDPLYAEALHVNTSYLTAVANDYSFDEVFSRMVKAKGRPGDVLFCLSTSGNSANVVKAAEKARINGLKTIGFTGKKGGALNEYCDLMICVPSDDIPRIQESHIVIGHIVCQLVEAELFSNP